MLHGALVALPHRFGMAVPPLREPPTLTTIQRWRFRGNQTQVSNILNAYENIDINILLSFQKDSRTRGHEVTLMKDQCRSVWLNASQRGWNGSGWNICLPWMKSKN